MESDSDDETILDYFFGGKPNKKFVAPKPQIETILKCDPKLVEVDHSRDSKTNEYSERHRLKEESLLANQTFNQPTTSNTIVVDDSGDDSDDSLTLTFKKEKEDPELPELNVYQRYCFNTNPQDLPILKKHEIILSTIDRNRVVVLSSATGTGKSSQVPQYILKQAFKSNQNCNIVVTQPRRIAAISIAKRVAMEMKCECGTLVGYQVGLDKQCDTNINSDTRILFCTTGVLLQKLINERTMKRYTHVILDEVHERDIEMDMLLIVVRRLLATQNPYVKIILMSATLNAEKFAEYFKVFDSRGNYGAAPILNLNVPRPHPVAFTYLDVLEHIGASRNIIDIERPGISNEMYKVGVQAISLVLQKSQGRFSPSFLVFLPGLQEINCFKRELCKPNRDFNISDFHLVILHSSISTEDYSKAFDSSIDRKIILATNIAESSITLSVRFVIDFCLTKYQTTDTALNMTQLKLNWASRMNLEQRAGRVGRVEAGQIVRMMFQDQFNQLPKEPEPEMMRASLEQVVLKTKRLDMGRPSSILALALDPPAKSAIENSILVLKEIGGFTRFTKRGKFDINDGDLTFAGKIMARLPVDVRISKLIVMGYLFSCVEECIIIGAGLSSKSIFKTNLMSTKQKMEGYHQKMKLSRGSASDFIAILNAYQSWRRAVGEGLSEKAEQIWCDHQTLNRKNLSDMKDLIDELKTRLRYFGIDSESVGYRYTEEEKIFALKISIAGAFYPNYFAFGGKQPSRDEYQTLLNTNPCDTVYLKGMKINRIGQIYEEQVRQALQDKDVTENLNDMRVKFDGNSTRLVVNFKPFDVTEVIVPGAVCLEVYKALKLSKLDKKIKIKSMPSNQEDIYVTQLGLGHYENGRFKLFQTSEASDNIYLPKSEEKIQGTICHIVNCNKFFFQPNSNQRHLQMQEAFLREHSKSVDPDDKFSVESRVIVKHNDLFKRGQIIDDGDEDDSSFLVSLKDYGEVVQVNQESFFTLPEQSSELVFKAPPQCYECRLCEIIPSAVGSPFGWSDKTLDEFKKFCEDKWIEIEIYSFIDQVASVRVFATVHGISNCLNEHLLVKGYAQRCDESYASMVDRLNRDLMQHQELNTTELDDELTYKYIESPPSLHLTEDIELDGPISPLEANANLRSLFRARPNEIQVDQYSVNHVLLDPFPNDGIEKVLVAASMSMYSKGKVALHQTMIMPQLPGIGALLGLLFSPTAEVRSSSDCSRYSSILTGLGCDITRKSHYGQHDCLFYVDAMIDEQDIDAINEIRFNMSTLMESEHMKYKNQNDLRKKIRSMLMKLASKDRTPLGLSMKQGDWEWSTESAAAKSSEAVYSKIRADRLNELSEENRRDLKRHAEEIARKAETNSRNESIYCRLCEERIETVHELQLHVMKRLHKDNYLNIRSEPMGTQQPNFSIKTENF